MIYRVSPEIFERCPSFCRAVVVLSDLQGQDRFIPELDHKLRERIREVEGDPAVTVDHPRIQAWRETYKRFLPKESRRSEPSVATLVKRIKKGKGTSIPFIAPMVCISNLVSLECLFPSGLIDRQEVHGDLVLGLAEGGEQFEPVGSSETRTVEAGEVIYYDHGTKAVLCAGWNSRAGRSTLIRPSTSRAILDVDGLLTAAPASDVQAAALRVADLAATYCGAKAHVHFLTQLSPHFMVET